MIDLSSDVCSSDLLSAAREAGRDVGADIALAGFDDIPAGRDITPGLTTVRVPLELIGYDALRAAVDADWEPRGGLDLEVVLRGSKQGRGWEERRGGEECVSPERPGGVTDI